jgi:nitroreductase
MNGQRLTRQLAGKLIEAAVAAPSILNTQPWRFTARLTEEIIELYADPARMLRRTDPDGRGVHISCGAALFNLRLAVSCAAVEPVTRLLPQPGNPQLLATVRLAGPQPTRARERDLHAAIWRRHTTRTPCSGPPVSGPALAALAEAAALEGATLVLRDDPGALAASEGVARQFTGRPQVAVLTTRTGSRADWIRAGQALQRVLLLATEQGLTVSLLSQVREDPDPDQDHGPGPGGQRPQLILQFGYGTPGPATTRRPVTDVLRIVTEDDPAVDGPPVLAGPG